MTPSATERSNLIFNHSVRRRRTAISVAASLTILANAGAPTRAQSGPVANEIVELLPSDGQVADQFGAAVSVSGDTAIIGAPFGDGDMAETGSVYVYVQDTTGVWTREAKLLASDSWVYHLFGAAVSISDGTAVVGAPLGDGNVAGAGAAYVFVRDASGVWTQQAKLIASDGASDEQFGFSVAISGDTAIIGAALVDDACPGNPECNSGAAYVFGRDATGTWTQQIKLLALDGAANDYFGKAVAVNGATAVIGANGDNDNGAHSGSAYVFVRDASGVWAPQAKLLASDGGANESFGISVAIIADTAVVGASGIENNGMASGSAYVFIRGASGVWAQQAKLLASDGIINESFGISVAINSDIAVIGASGNGLYAGSAYVFVRGVSGVWTQRAKLLASNGLANDLLGISVAVRSDVAIVGSLGLSVGKAGAAYTFSLLSPADFNGDGVVNASDLAILLPQWGAAGSADLDASGAVDAADLATLLANWGP